MTQTMTFQAEPRTAVGTRSSRAVRETGMVPAVIYGHGEPPETISLSRHDIEVALKHGARTLQVAFHGKTLPYLIREVQYDHFGIQPIHLDLARVNLDERVRLRVGIELRGVPKGVADGGVLDQHMAKMEIECLVTEIPDTLRPIVSHLGLGETLHVKDLVLPPGIRALAKPDDRVASVHALAEAPAPPPPAEGEEAAVAEPERIGRLRKEEGEEEGAAK